jgi:hypothetical protein
MSVAEKVRMEDIPGYREHKEVIDKVIAEVTQLAKASFAKAVMYKAEGRSYQ